MPTIRRCCIVGCLSNSRQNPHMQFFQFPRPENPFHKMWKEACHASLRRILPFKKPVVCALHFDPCCLGGRRLTSNAVPSLRLEVPSNLEAVEQQAMIEEIERSRKCAYINAVVYEWLVRANTNPQLRGSITHGMIKEKAENARAAIGSNAFIADNRWLNRFRETHLSGFAQKLATNQLKPMGSSLWIQDIVQDLQHLFPPASAERVAKLEDMPEQYINYMQQYGEYEEDEEDSKDHGYIEQQQQAHFQMQQTQQQQHLHHMQQIPQPPPHFNHPHHPGFDPYAQHPNYSSNFNDYFAYERQQQQQQQHHHQQQLQHHQQQHLPPYPPPIPLQQRPSSLSPPTQQQTPLRTSPFQPPNMQARLSPFQPPNPQTRTSPFQMPLKRPKLENTDDEVREITSTAQINGTHEVASPIEDLTDENDANQTNNNGNINGHTTPPTKSNGTTPIITQNGNGSASGTPSPKSNVISNGSGSETNGNTSPAASLATNNKDLETYAQALEYLKPLEDFVLFKENFRAIGLLSQLEAVLRKGEKATLIDH